LERISLKLDVDKTDICNFETSSSPPKNFPGENYDQDEEILISSVSELIFYCTYLVAGMSNGPINDPIGVKSKVGWLAK